MESTALRKADMIADKCNADVKLRFERWVTRKYNKCSPYEFHM